MKKIFALILALLLLGSTFACAESTNALTISDPILDMTTDGQNVTLNFEGLTLRFAAVSVDEKPVVVADVLGNGDVLFSAAAQIDGRHVLLTATGLSHSYGVDLPGEGEASLSVDFQLDSSVIESLMAQAEIGMDGTNITFHLPYTAVNGLLKEILPQLEQIPNSEELLGQLEELEKNDSGVNIDGFVSMSFDRGQLSITPVENGQAAEQPAAILDGELSMFDDGLDATIYFTIPEESADPVGCMELTFRSGDESVKLDVNVYALAGSAKSKLAEFDFSYDETFSLEIEVVDTLDFEVDFDPASGMLEIDVQAEDVWLNLSATVATGEADVTPLSFPASEVEITEMSDAESEQLAGELQNAVMPLLGFVLPALMQSGLAG